ncbi:MAG: HD domain-containing protein [Actinobacteria bacterium]|nr:HD domain-containing protein [Actinomycetota bacterium]
MRHGAFLWDNLKSDDPFFIKILDFVAKRDEDVYLVGGYLRDLLIGRGSKDIDLSLRGDVINYGRLMADYLEGSFVLLDDVHQVVRVVVKEKETVRTVDFAEIENDIENDLMRRDFSVNALALNLKKFIEDKKFSLSDIVDVTGGLADLENKRIHAVSSDIFQEDSIRLLRVLRIGHKLGFYIDAETKSFVIRDSDLIKEAKSERINDELFQIFSLPNVLAVIKNADEFLLIKSLFPEIEETKGVIQNDFHHLDVWNHSLLTLSNLENIVSNLDDNFKGFRDENKFSATFPLSKVLSEPPPLSKAPSKIPPLPKILPEIPPLPKMLSEIPPLPKGGKGGLSNKILNHLNQPVMGTFNRLAVLKFAALFHDVGKPAVKFVDSKERIRFFNHAEVGFHIVKNISARLRLSKKITEIFTRIVKEHMRPGFLIHEKSLTSKAIYRLFRDLGDETIEVLLISLADRMAAQGVSFLDGFIRHNNLIEVLMGRYFEYEEEKAKKVKLLSGQDLIDNFNLAPGPQIGRLLSEVEEASFHGLIATKKDALDFVAERLALKNKRE